MAAEAYTQVAADGVGNKIRNLSMEVIQDDGTTATVQMQVVSIVDRDGREVDLAGDGTNDLLRALLREMTTLRKMYGRATGLMWMGLDSAMIDDTVG